MDDDAKEIGPRVDHSPWRPFDAKAREEFCDYLRNGVTSRPKVIALMRLSPGLVAKWFARGSKDEYELGDYEKRAFVLDVRSAEAARDAAPELRLFEAAIGEIVPNNDDSKDAPKTKRQGGDYRAAIEYKKLQERTRLQRHEEAMAEAKAREARANARVAEVKAVVAEQAAKKINAMVIFQAEFMARLKPSERAVLEAAMQRERVIETPADMVDDILQGQDTSDIDELEEGLRRHPHRTSVASEKLS